MGEASCRRCGGGGAGGEGAGHALEPLVQFRRHRGMVEGGGAGLGMEDKSLWAAGRGRVGGGAGLDRVCGGGVALGMVVGGGAGVGGGGLGMHWSPSQFPQVGQGGGRGGGQEWAVGAVRAGARDLVKVGPPP